LAYDGKAVSCAVMLGGLVDVADEVASVVQAAPTS